MLKRLVFLFISSVPSYSGESLRTVFFSALRKVHVWVLIFITILLSIFYYLDITYVKDNIEWIWRFRVFEYLNNINGSLFYFVIIYAGIVFGWIGIVIFWIVSLAIAMPVVADFTFRASAMFSNVVFLSGPVMITLFFVILIKSIAREKKIYDEREAERQAYMRQVFKAQEDERKRISQELHDNTIQDLLALSNQMQSILNKEGKTLSPQMQFSLDSFSSSISSISNDLRRLSIDLRPSILDDIGLVEALRSLIDNCQSENIQVVLTTNGNHEHIIGDTDVIIFRFVQEALNNALKHSKASSINVRIDFDSSLTKITIQDDGIGFLLPKTMGEFINNKKLGIIGMYERAKLLNGHLNIQSALNKGTLISLEFEPLLYVG